MVIHLKPQYPPYPTYKQHHPPLSTSKTPNITNRPQYSIRPEHQTTARYTTQSPAQRCSTPQQFPITDLASIYDANSIALQTSIHTPPTCTAGRVHRRAMDTNVTCRRESTTYHPRLTRLPSATQISTAGIPATRHDLDKTPTKLPQTTNLTTANTVDDRISNHEQP